MTRVTAVECDVVSNVPRAGGSEATGVCTVHCSVIDCLLLYAGHRSFALWKVGANAVASR